MPPAHAPNRRSGTPVRSPRSAAARSSDAAKGLECSPSRYASSIVRTGRTYLLRVVPRRAVGTAFCAAVFLLVGCGSGGGGHTLRGRILQSKGGLTSPVTQCDLTQFPNAPGAGQVVVEDGNGRAIGRGTIHVSSDISSVVHPSASVDSGTDPGDTVYAIACTWSFSVRVPDAERYRITIGGWKPISATRAQLATHQWDVSLLHLNVPPD